MDHYAFSNINGSIEQTERNFLPFILSFGYNSIKFMNEEKYVP